jgi:hypothetical protein
MTEYELADVITSYSVQGGTFFAIWITIVSAYAVVAYGVGASLTQSQVVWLNTLYLYTCLIMVFGIYGSFNTQVHYVTLLKELNPDSPQIMTATVANGVALVTAIGTVVTLKFMWDIRHRKTE